MNTGGVDTDLPSARSSQSSSRRHGPSHSASAGANVAQHERRSGAAVRVRLVANRSLLPDDEAAEGAEGAEGASGELPDVSADDEMSAIDSTVAGWRAEVDSLSERMAAMHEDPPEGVVDEDAVTAMVEQVSLSVSIARRPVCVVFLVFFLRFSCGFLVPQCSAVQCSTGALGAFLSPSPSSSSSSCIPQPTTHFRPHFLTRWSSWKAGLTNWNDLSTRLVFALPRLLPATSKCRNSNRNRI